MKFKYLSAAAMGLAVLMSSCDATDLKPWDSMTDQSYWHTVTDLQLYANGLLQNFGGATVSGDAVSDIMVQSSVNSYLFGTMTLNDASGWDWGLIRQCNFFMNRYEQVVGDEAAINQYVGEVRFVRANRYYYMIRTFGDVPWFDSDLQTTDTEELYKGRDPRNFVLGKIIEDLEFAAKWCTDSKAGRPTKDAALQQLARVCLYYGTYMKYHNEQESNGISSTMLLEKARDASKKIMDSGNYSIVKAANPSDTKNFDEWPLPYSNLFVQDDLSGCPEAVMARYYEYPTLTHEVGRQAGSSNFGFSKAFIDMYLMKDGTPIANAGSGYHGDNTLEEEIQDRDPRMWQTIATSRRPNWTSAGSGADMQMTPWNWANTLSMSEGGVTGYAVEKFHSSNMAQWQAQASDFDWFIYRYAEVLLINAEANFELGTCTQDVLDATINKLRDRVDMAHLTTSPAVDAAALDYGYSVAPLLYEIRRERAIELCNEGFRMDDLKRWNAMKLLENPKTMVGVRITAASKAFYENPDNGGTEIGAGKRETVDVNGRTYIRVFNDEIMNSAGRKWTANDKRWLYPIPKEQIDLYQANGTPISQNPGW